LNEGAAGEATIIVRGRGQNLTMPPLPVRQPLKVQLINSKRRVLGGDVQHGDHEQPERVQGEAGLTFGGHAEALITGCTNNPSADRIGQGL